MSGSRPPTLHTLAYRLIRDESLFRSGDRVLCACSGGPDSNALLHVLALLRRRIGHRLLAVGVDHGLRRAGAAELEVGRGLAHAHDIPFKTVAVALEPGPNLQARARSARHEALQDIATRRGAAVIAVGHTADDRAETVLMRLMRGAGPRGLAAMPARSTPGGASEAPAAVGVAAGDQAAAAPIVRPLLRARRQDVLHHLERHGLPFCQDPSNDDRRFLRVRVRRELLPLLEQLAPGVVEHLCALAEMLRDESAGDPLAGLGRAQRQAITRLLRAGKGRTTVRVSGGRDLELRFFSRRTGSRGEK